MTLDFKLLEEKPLRLSNDKLREYILESTESLYSLINKINKIQKGGLAYTSFIPIDVSFEGYWAPYSSTTFWGLGDDEKKKAILSSFIYYSLFPDVKPYTELWIEIISSILPYNLLIEFNTNSDFELEINQNIRLVKIKCSNNLYDELSTFLNSIYNSINRKNNLKSEILNLVNVKEDKLCFHYNFRSIQFIIKENNDIKEFLNKVINTDKESLLNKASQLSQILKQELNSHLKAKLDSFDKKMDEMSKIILKLLLIGPEPTKHLLLINPKQFKNGKYIGCLGVIIRSYDSQYHNEIYSTILPYINIVAFRITSAYLYDFFIQHARHSAVSAIMARNMSHNIDSHVTPRAKIEAIRKRFKQLQFEEDLDVIQLLKDRLDEYRQKRADFLAEVTSEPLTSTKPALFYRDVILPLIQNTLFMDDIARNEGICYRNKTDNRLRIRVFFEDTELKADFRCATGPGNGNQQPASYTYPNNGIPYTAHCTDCNYTSSTENHSQKPSVLVGIPKESKDIEIELPGPVGEHAFYGFLENLIRNVAKHNRQHFDKNPKENLEINIRISEPEDKEEKKEFYVIEVWDNVTDPNKQIDVEVDGKNYTNLYELISAYIKSDVIDETGKKKEQAYGIAEMKVDATLLGGSRDFARMKDFLKVLREQRPATEYENSAYKTVQKKRLVYRFRLMKAKKMCGVFPQWVNDELRTNLQDQGIWIFDKIVKLKEAILPDETGKSKGLRSAASFRFAVFDCSGENGQEIIDEIKNLLPYLPFRIIILAGDNKLNNIPDGARVVYEDRKNFPQNAQEIMRWLWTRWLQRKEWGNNDKILEIYLDQQNCQESPTKEWAQYAREFNNICNNPYHVRVWSSESLCSGDNERIGQHIFFDRHALGVEVSTFNGHFREEHSYIFLDKLNSDFPKVFQPSFPDNQHDWLLPFELIESGLLMILVIDERLAEACLRLVDDTDASRLCRKLSGFTGLDPTIWHVALGAKVYICTHFGVNSDPQPLHKSSYEQAESEDNRLLPFLSIRVNTDAIFPESKTIYRSNGEKSDLKIELDGFDMVIIHQGILDEWLGNMTQELFLEVIQKQIPFVVIDSGRGIPPNLPKGYKFLSYSILQDLVASKRVAKYNLTQLVMSLTRKKK